MSVSAIAPGPQQVSPDSLRRIIFASIVGSMIEWYDFTLYGTAATLVFGRLFFPSADPAVGTLISIAAYGVGFLARPLGGAIFGHYGDRIGRKRMLALTVIIMGAGTFLIGCLPTYGAIGIGAPILLIALRLVQGIGIGGEWGGAVLMMVENAKPHQRGFFGSLVQAGSPFGVLASIAVFALVSNAMSDADFLAWGWRIPFLISIVLVGIGLWIRLSLVETPAFQRILANAEVKRTPLIEVLTHHRRMFFTAIALKVSEIAWAVVGTVFSIVYVTGKLGMPRGTILTAIQIAAFIQMLITPFYGFLSDRFGRKPLYIFACLFSMAFAFPVFSLMDTKDPWLIIVAISIAVGIGQGVMFGVGATFMSELFDTSVRYSGASMGFQIGAALSGGFTPLIAASLLKGSDGQSWGISVYLIVLAAITLFATVSAPETAHKTAELIMITWNGTIVALHSCAAAGQAMQAADSLSLLAGQGIAGDRYLLGTGYYSPKPEEGRQITFFEVETLEAMLRDYRITLTPAEHRRNVTVSGVPLNHLVGKRLRIGDTLMEATRLSIPCRYIEEVTGKSIFKALMHRSGLNCRILEGGVIRTGDAIGPG